MTALEIVKGLQALTNNPAITVDDIAFLIDAATIVLEKTKPPEIKQYVVVHQDTQSRKWTFMGSTSTIEEARCIDCPGEHTFGQILDLETGQLF